MEDFEKELKLDFLLEAFKILTELEKAFLQLENDKTNTELMDEIFRHVHTLKGSSRAVGFGDLAEFTHEMESFIIKIKQGTLLVTDSVVSGLLQCNDHLTMMIKLLDMDLDSRFDSSEIVATIKNINNDTAKDTPVHKAPEEHVEPIQAPIQEIAEKEIPSAETSVEPVIDDHEDKIAELIPLRADRNYTEPPIDRQSTVKVLFVEFSMGDENYAIPISKTKEMISVPKTTIIPNLPKYVIGIVNLRGVIIPIIDLRVKFGITPVKNKGESVIILDINGSYVGIIVDSINKVISVSYSELGEVQNIESQMSAKFLDGIYMKENEKMTIILNIVRVLKDK